jgi:hypothetical protein
MAGARPHRAEHRAEEDSDSYWDALSAEATRRLEADARASRTTA